MKGTLYLESWVVKGRIDKFSVVKLKEKSSTLKQPINEEATKTLFNMIISWLLPAIDD